MSKTSKTGTFGASLLMLLAALSASVQTALAQWTGNGTEAAPYEINTTADWDALATSSHSTSATL